METHHHSAKSEKYIFWCFENLALCTLRRPRRRRDLHYFLDLLKCRGDYGQASICASDVATDSRHPKPSVKCNSNLASNYLFVFTCVGHGFGKTPGFTSDFDRANVKLFTLGNMLTRIFAIS